jgi:hypothetical protein
VPLAEPGAPPPPPPLPPPPTLASTAAALFDAFFAPRPAADAQVAEPRAPPPRETKGWAPASPVGDARGLYCVDAAYPPRKPAGPRSPFVFCTGWDDEALDQPPPPPIVIRGGARAGPSNTPKSSLPRRALQP